MTMRSVLLPPLVLLLITAYVPSRSMDLRFPNQTVELRVGANNIRSGLSTDGSLGLEKIAREIEQARLDLVFLQEVDRGTRRADRRNQAEELGRLLGMEWVYAVALSSPLPPYPAQNPQYAIDRIVASPPAHVAITDTGAGPLGSSDHLLLVSTLRIDPVSHACQ